MAPPERGVAVRALMAQREALWKERDELVAVLKEVLSDCSALEDTGRNYIAPSRAVAEKARTVVQRYEVEE